MAVKILGLVLGKCFGGSCVLSLEYYEGVCDVFFCYGVLNFMNKFALIILGLCRL